VLSAEATEAVLVTTSSFMNRLPIHTLGQLWVVAAVYTCLSQTHLMSKIVRSHPRFAGPDLMQPAIRLQESDFPKQAHPYPSLCKFLPPLTWVLVSSLCTKLS